MAAEQYLDYLPINPSLINKRDLVSDLLYKQQMYLAINTAQVEQLLADYQSNLGSFIEAGETATLRQLNFYIETVLSNLLIISTLTQPDGTELTSHHYKRKSLVPDHFQTLNASFLESIFYTSQKTWGGRYGSLGYYLYLSQYREHYQTPSQLINKTVSYLLDLLPYREFANLLKSLLLVDSPDADRLIYQASVSIFEQIPGVPTCLKLLTFLQSWLPKVISWYLANYNQDIYKLPNEPNEENRLTAYRTLVTVAQSAIDFSIEADEQLAYKFIHQEISPVYYSFIRDVIQARRECLFIPSVNSKSQEELLVSELLEILPPDADISLIKDTSLEILSNLAPPGGFNLWLVAVSGSLLNRAYILTHPSNCSFVDEDIFTVVNSLPPLSELYGRVMRLIFLAGYCLTKSNISSLILTGFNLLSISGQLTDRPSRTFDLTK